MSKQSTEGSLLNIVARAHLCRACVLWPIRIFVTNVKVKSPYRSLFDESPVAVESSREPLCKATVAKTILADTISLAMNDSVFNDLAAVGEVKLGDRKIGLRPLVFVALESKLDGVRVLLRGGNDGICIGDLLHEGQTLLVLIDQLLDRLRRGAGFLGDAVRGLDITESR
jgi:hypothetical protein